MISKWLNKKNISKKKLFFGWHTAFWFYKSQGANMTGNYKSIITNVGFWGFLISYFLKIDILIIGKWIFILIAIDVLGDWLVGFQRVKHKMLEFEANYLSKQRTISPFNVELKETVEDIAERVGGKSHFKEL